MQNGTPPTGGAPRKRKKKGGGPGAAAVALTVGKVLGTLILIGICTCAILACFAAFYIKTVILPQAHVDASTFKMDLSSTIYYNDPDTGALRELRTLHGDENRVLVDYADIPQNLVHAAVAIEDKRFYEHDGVDWRRTIGAFGNMFLSMRNNFGGSTLTQQLIKNMTEKDEVTVQRKILEIFSALDFEKTNSKEDILEMYLNYIFLGEGCYGVGTAAYTYFGKDVSQLSLAECASLIGITNNPSAYDPYISENTRKNNKARQELILDEMCDQGYITEAERDAAKAETLVFQRGEDETRPVVVYSYYEDEIIRDVIEDLKSQLDMSEIVATQMVYSGGLSIYSCYNPKVQASVDAVYGDVANLPDGSTSKSGQQLQSAITVIDNATGNVVAVAGGVGKKEGSLTQNRAVKTIRPPGSSIKPLAVYAPALEVGAITPATVRDDSPYNEDNGGWPINVYSGYRGLCTTYEAVQDSINTIAVKTLMDAITPELAYNFLTKNENGMGGLGLSTDHVIMAEEINGKVFSDIGPAQLALGGLTHGVSTLEMAGAYSTFARSGVYVEPRTYTRVEDSAGNVILDNVQETHPAMKESTAWYINYMLKNVVAQGSGTKAKIPGMTVAGKTGTTSSRKDVWFAGYTTYYTAVVWSGYDQQERLASSLGNPSVVLWQKVMSKVHEGLENNDFPTPTGQSIVTVGVCRDSGLLPNPDGSCAHDARGSRIVNLQFVSGDQPTMYCDRHTDVEVCLADPILNDKGEATGMYHLAGEFCPENAEGVPGRRTVGVVDYQREGAADVPTRDRYFMKSYLDGLGDAAICTVHNSAPDPEPTDDPMNPGNPNGGGGPVAIDPNDPSTWPDDPGFNPYDPSTWPSQQPSQDPTPPEVSTTPEVTPPNDGRPEGIPFAGEPEYIPASGT